MKNLVAFRGRSLTLKYSVDETSAEILERALDLQERGWLGPPAVCVEGVVIYRWIDAVAAEVAGYEPVIHTIYLPSGDLADEFRGELEQGGGQWELEYSTRLLRRHGVISDEDVQVLIANIAAYQWADIDCTPYHRLRWDICYHDSDYKRHIGLLWHPVPETSRSVLAEALAMRRANSWLGAPALRIGDHIRLGYRRAVAASLAGVNPQVYHLQIDTAKPEAREIYQELIDKGITPGDIVYYIDRLLQLEALADPQVLQVAKAWAEKQGGYLC
ncbi:MAG: hypothetical protein KatS3mg038_2514 [Candidatus Kapaibacterium sp.]|nr:MAG: hypothetical protein KatS3mg038_2514 [Candidatus Kapabacteria bacterium]